MIKIIKIFFLIAIIVSNARASQTNNSLSYNTDSKPYTDVETINQINFIVLKKVLTNYSISQFLLQDFNFQKIDYQRPYDNSCRSDVYQLHLNKTKVKGSPYVEYNPCSEGVKSLSFHGTGDYLRLVKNLMKEAISDGFKEDYTEFYDDGSFEQEYSKGDYAIAYSQEILEDGNFVQSLQLMLIE